MTSAWRTCESFRPRMPRSCRGQRRDQIAPDAATKSQRGSTYLCSTDRRTQVHRSNHVTAEVRMTVSLSRIGIGAGVILGLLPLMASAQNYVQKNLVSDMPQPANADGSMGTIDPPLKNPWGLARGAASPWWPNNGGTGASTLYAGTGNIVPLVVTVPNGEGITTH